MDLGLLFPSFRSPFPVPQGSSGIRYRRGHLPAVLPPDSQQGHVRGGGGLRPGQDRPAARQNLRAVQRLRPQEPLLLAGNDDPGLPF